MGTAKGEGFSVGGMMIAGNPKKGSKKSVGRETWLKGNLWHPEQNIRGRGQDGLLIRENESEESEIILKKFSLR